jgi:hypothetical protein
MCAKFSSDVEEVLSLKNYNAFVVPARTSDAMQMGNFIINVTSIDMHAHEK